MASWIWKAAGTVAAVAVAGAAVVAAEKLMQKQQNDIDRKIQEDLARQSAEVDVPVTPEQDAPAEPEKSESEPQPKSPVQDEVPGPQQPAGPDGPNVNPVMAGPAETPRTADGKIDVSKLCDPADFQDWDMLGCQS